MSELIQLHGVVEAHGGGSRSLARITVPAIPNLVCDLWCYEDKFGVGETHEDPAGRDPIITVAGRSELGLRRHP